MAAAAGPEPADERIKVRVIRGEDRGGIVYYIINVELGDGDGKESHQWSSAKRYSQFEEFHSQLLVGRSQRDLPAGAALPAKRFKLFTPHNTKEFIEERRCLLDSYLKKIAASKTLSSNDIFLKFLSSDKLPVAEASPASPSAAQLPDDVEITDIRIPTTRTMSDHVLYQIDVTNSRKRKTYSKWTVLKRFGQLYEMDSAMRADYAEDPAALADWPAPPERKTKLLIDHMDEDFIEHRRVLLENYLQKCVQHPVIIRNKHFLLFLGVSVDE